MNEQTLKQETILWLVICTAMAGQAIAEDTDVTAAPAVTATGHRMRLDLDWTGWKSGATSYRILRSDSPDGPFEPLRDAYGLTVYSDFLASDGIVKYYKVQVLPAGATGAAAGQSSGVVRGESRAEDRDAFLTGLQEASLRYFTAYAHPVSGLARECGRTNPPPHVQRTCAIGATGMGLMNLVVGVERKLIPRDQARHQLVGTLRFLQKNGEKYDGVFPHWMNGETGRTIVFGGVPGGDVVETSLLMQGLITVREYFSGDDDLDREIRSRADTLWRAVQWDRLVDEDGRLYWHWPIKGLERPMRITGSNEGHIAYLLAAASPTHPAPPATYFQGWVRTHRVVNQKFYGVNLEVGRPYGVPLFWTHYSYLGLDPRGLYDERVTDYFQHHRNVALIHWNHAQTNPGKFAGYGSLRWGLTASMGPDGYSAWTPVRNDHGTIAPTAALSSMPYVPEQSLAMLDDLYEKRGADLWGAFGFYDAFNDSRAWVARDAWIGIDVGPIAPMIENYRTGLCWRLFTNAPEIQQTIKRLEIRKAPDTVGGARFANDTGLAPEVTDLNAEDVSYALEHKLP